MKKMIKQIGISCFILLLLVLPSMAMAEPQIEWGFDEGGWPFMKVWDPDSPFLCEPGHMRLKFGENGYIEIWWDPNTGYGYQPLGSLYRLIWVTGN